ncbi:right-handed parallel beta-helix repeat-containing protein [Spirillospora sp. CA-294931]|uniref:right-handed parallel beta-helix repeat-containing protein n=1 Tax=Spirillospora sp. CA-294931 TaxID=3240042 RepID=UPI003D913DF6
MTTAKLVVAAGLAVPIVFGGPAAWATPAKQLFVAPGGQDSWPGTAERPFKTLERARQAVRAERSDVVVNLRGGTHTLTAPLTLTAADSGSSKRRVTYQAYAREPVTLSGGRAVGGWHASGGIWRADVGTLDTRQLFVGGKRATRATLGRGVPGKLTKTATGYVTDSPVPRSWRNPQDIEFLYTFADAFSEGRCGVAGISGTGDRTTITMDQPCFRRANGIYGEIIEDPPGLKPPTAVENSDSFLTGPGTWYLDRSRPGHHQLLYKPRPGETPNRTPVTAPVLESLIAGNGVQDVTFRGLTFADTTWLAPGAKEGFPHIIGGWYYVGDDPKEQKARSTPGAVAFRNSKRLTFERNRFTRLGGLGLELAYGASGHLVRGNVFHDLSSGGVEIGGDEEGTGRHENNRVENNWVHHIGIDYRGGWGILLNVPFGSTVAHNQVNATPYSGIVYLNSGGTSTSSQGTRILDNRVFDTNNALIDGGGIYGNGPQGPSFAKGALVRGNDVHSITNPVAPEEVYPPYAIYSDDHSDHATITGNVIHSNQKSLGGVAPGRIRFTGNFWDDTKPVWWGESKDVEITRNTVLPRKNPRPSCLAKPACAAIIANAGLQPAYRDLLG